MGLSEARWRGIKLSVTRLLGAASGHGKASDAALYYKQAMAAHFGGVEPCTICYAIISESGKVPQLPCRSCANKFHQT